jgi:hypothetical protein
MLDCLQSEKMWTLLFSKVHRCYGKFCHGFGLGHKRKALPLFITKPTRCTNFQNLFWHETLHVSGISYAHHQEFIHCTLGTGICHTGSKRAFELDQDGPAVLSWSCSKAVFKPVWQIAVPSVQWINFWRWAEELPETCKVSCQSNFGNWCIWLVLL